MSYKYDFSIISAIYNCESYLKEAIDSIINQTIGFERIQLILVDDGSEDNSGKICEAYKKKYPNNIVVIHKENGGVSSARNAGLEVAEGEFVNFMDSDDKWKTNAFKYAYRFFRKAVNVDVATFRLFFFDARRGEHYLNNKFTGKTRVVDLTKEPTAVQMNCNATFFRRSAIGDTRFDTNLKYAEDSKFTNSSILKKLRLGLINSSNYFYRVRSDVASSVIQNAISKLENYHTKIDYFTLYFLDKKKYDNNIIPKYIQNMILYDLQWHIKEYSKIKVLADDELDAYRKKLIKAIKQIDIDVIVDCELFNESQKIYLLKKYHGLDSDSEICKTLLSTMQFVIASLVGGNADLPNTTDAEKFYRRCFRGKRSRKKN